MLNMHIYYQRISEKKQESLNIAEEANSTVKLIDKDPLGEELENNKELINFLSKR